MFKRSFILYVPKEIPEGINTPKEHPLVALYQILLPAMLLIATAFFIMHLLLGWLVHYITPEMEMRWGSEVFRFESDSNFLIQTKPEVIHLANELWQSFTSEPHLKLKVDTLETTSQNAYMTVGGRMLLTQGLIEKAQSENEIAMVICHELGHLYHRHVIHQAGLHIIWMMVVSLVSPSGGYSHSIDFLAGRRFIREQEVQADYFGLDCLYKKYGHVNGSKSFFQRMSEEQEGSFLDQIPDFLSTHPHFENRISNLHNYAVEKNYSWDGPLTPNSFHSK